MFKNHFLCTTLFFVCSYFGLDGSDRKEMEVRVQNNLSSSMTVTLDDRISAVQIDSQEADIKKTSFKIEVDDEPSKIKNPDELKKYDATLLSEFTQALENIWKNKGNYSITRTDNDPNYTYQTLSHVFKQLINYHWTILPSSGTMNVEILRLEYPKGTTALGLKKIIYEKVAERNQATAFYPDIAIQNDMYNILIKFGPNPAADDYKMPDIDSDFMKGEFSLTLSKSQFQSVYINNSNLQFIFINPPSLSIGKKGKDKKPVLENFGMSLTNSKIDTTITVRYNEQQRQEVLSGRPAFVEGRETVISNESFAAEFNNFKKNPNLVNVVTKNETDLQQQLAFFKTALTEWAKANNREVSFQGEQLYPKPQASKSTGGARPPSKPTSWFSSGWQKIKSLFSTTKSRVITALTVLGIIGAGTAMYKNWFPGFPGVKFPSTPRTSQQTPAMPGFPQK